MNVSLGGPRNGILHHHQHHHQQQQRHHLSLSDSLSDSLSSTCCCSFSSFKTTDRASFKQHQQLLFPSGGDVESNRGGRNNRNNNAFAVLNEELRRDVLIASVSNADHLSETLEQAHKIATETDDAGETILKSLSQQKNRLLSARAAATSMERDMESSERKLRRMGYEKCVQKWMWHVVALCFIGALGTFVYFKITNPDSHHKNGHRLSDYKILETDEDTGKFV